MTQGTIKKLVADRGFGFIASSGKELFFHHTSVVGGAFESLAEGQTVEFEVDDAPNNKGKGPRAIDGQGGLALRGRPSVGSRTAKLRSS